MKNTVFLTGAACLAIIVAPATAGASADMDAAADANNTAAASETAPATAAVRQSAQVYIAVTDLRSQKGTVMACLTRNERKFPKCDKDPQAIRAKVPANSSEVVFRDVPPGRYAVALLHDENNNGKADKAITMIPREGFGFSRDAKVRMGPPRFADAVVDISSGRRAMTIRMRYML